MYNSTIRLLRMHKHRNDPSQVAAHFVLFHTARESGTDACRVVTFSSAYQHARLSHAPACWSTYCLIGTKRMCRGRIQSIYRPHKVAPNFKASLSSDSSF